MRVKCKPFFKGCFVLHMFRARDQWYKYMRFSWNWVVRSHRKRSNVAIYSQVLLLIVYDTSSRRTGKPSSCTLYFSILKWFTFKGCFALYMFRARGQWYIFAKLSGSLTQKKIKCSYFIVYDTSSRRTGNPHHVHCISQYWNGLQLGMFCVTHWVVTHTEKDHM